MVFPMTFNNETSSSKEGNLIKMLIRQTEMESGP